ACALRGRNAAPVVRQGDPALSPRPTRPVPHHHALRARALKVGKAQDQNRRVVSEGDPDLQRRYRGGAPRNMGASNFFHVAATPRPRRNSAAYLASHAERARIRRLDRPKSSSECSNIQWSLWVAICFALVSSFVFSFLLWLLAAQPPARRQGNGTVRSPFGIKLEHYFAAHRTFIGASWTIPVEEKRRLRDGR